mmetsp:Transcript_23866/g.50609  ORF Transcript_23866/g.50609 Transcript_23866/m.50609 type:complete len:326 (-) Transcript_23866:208-1185(-)
MTNPPSSSSTPTKTPRRIVRGIFLPTRMTTAAAAAIVATLSIAFQLQVVESYVVGPGLGVNDMLSRFENVQCEIQMTVGRTPDTAMPPEWAASGAKLGLPLQVQFSPQAQDNAESILSQEPPETLLATAPDSPNFTVTPLKEPSFVSLKGVETVEVTEGRMACSLSSATMMQYSFRFFLDFPKGAVKNDVSLPAERIYFMTACWNKDDTILQQANQWKENLQKSLDKVNKEIEQTKSTPSTLLQKTLSFGNYWNLFEQCTEITSRLRALDDAFPSQDRLSAGPNDTVFLKDGVIAVKRYGKNGREEYHWVGTFGFKDFSSSVNAE